MLILHNIFLEMGIIPQILKENKKYYQVAYLNFTKLAQILYYHIRIIKELVQYQIKLAPIQQHT